jgi:hypothetical protein
MSPAALWCLLWTDAATVAAIAGYMFRGPIPKSLTVVAAALAWGGLWFHELIRVPNLLGFTPDGDLFMLPIVAALVYWWLRDDGGRAPSVALTVYAAVGLLGAVISVLPVGFLPFVPEQTSAHYFAHVVFAACQLPLLGVAAHGLRKPAAKEPAGHLMESASGSHE